ncbi:MAG: TIGR00282 family metallophosphoesterase [Clostridia bacterium]|nr:TIGR00282 family metallophosphoesterase [Clostridia bacterium]
MKVLAVGDLVGENGLIKLKKELPLIQEAEEIDFTIVNGENAAGGIGISKQNYEELKKLDIDVITMGNHTWGKMDIFKFINDSNIIRPANYSKGVPGKGYTILEKNNKKVAVINLIGRTDMGVLSDNPFSCIDNILNRIEVDIIILDFHAEATAEKVAMSYHLDGRISAMFGTHTHVQTADERIMKNGTGYITDIGMTGPIESVIGMDVKASLKRFVTSLPERYKLANGECKLNGCIFEIDDETCRTNKIYRINC